MYVLTDRTSANRSETHNREIYGQSPATAGGHCRAIGRRRVHVSRIFLPRKELDGKRGEREGEEGEGEGEEGA